MTEVRHGGDHSYWLGRLYEPHQKSSPVMQSQALRASRVLRFRSQMPLLVGRPTTVLRADLPVGNRFRPPNPYKDPSTFKEYFKLYYDPAGFPIIALCCMAVMGAAWYCWHLAKGPEVVWNRSSNPEPWNNVGERDQVKLVNYGGDFDKRYRRDRL